MLEIANRNRMARGMKVEDREGMMKTMEMVETMGKTEYLQIFQWRF